jgi:hypothetical protein
MDVFLSDGGVCSFWFAQRLLPGRRFRFPSILGLDESFQVAQVRAPEAAVLLDPGVNGAKWLWVELVDAVAAFAVFADQVGSAKKAKMLGDGRARNWESFGDLSCRLAAAAQQVENGTPGRIGESLEGCLGVSGRRIRNRTVTHNA